jgi:hypothetical protein
VHHCAAEQCPARQFSAKQCPAKQCPQKQCCGEQSAEKQCPAQPCPTEAYLSSAPATDTPIELEIRVLEIEYSQLKALGLAVAMFEGGDSEMEPFVGGFALTKSDSGLIGFLDALDREGLVKQDFALTGQVADGCCFETAVRWRVPNDAEKPDAWRNVALRIRPKLIPTGGICLQTACGAQYSKTYRTGLSAAKPLLVDFAAEVAGRTLGLAANCVTSEPNRAPQDEIRVVILITPHWKSTPANESDGKSCPDLLAPRNVLNRHAANATPSRTR